MTKEQRSARSTAASRPGRCGYPRTVNPPTLDHVALVGRRPRAHGRGRGRAARAAQDRADGALHAARRRRAPGQADALRRGGTARTGRARANRACASPRSTAASRSSTSVRGSSSRSSRRRPTRSLDLDHIALRSGDPEATARAGAARLHADRRRSARGRRRLPRADRGRPRRPRAAVAQPHRRARRVGGRAPGRGRGARRRDRRSRRRAEHARALRLGPDRVRLEYIEHKPSFSLT